MKKSTKLLTLAASILAMTFVVGCGQGNTPSSSSEPSQVVVDQGLADAVATLNEVMKSKNKVTTATYTLPAIVDTLDYTYQVEWSIRVHEGGLEGAVTLGTIDGGMQTITIVYNEEFSTVETVYDLVATVKGANGSEKIEFKDFSVPAYKYSTIAEWIAAKDTPHNPDGWFPGRFSDRA